MADRDLEREANVNRGNELHGDAARALNGEGEAAHRPRPEYQPQDEEESMTLFVLFALHLSRAHYVTLLPQLFPTTINISNAGERPCARGGGSRIVANFCLRRCVTAHGDQPTGFQLSSLDYWLNLLPIIVK